VPIHCRPDAHCRRADCAPQYARIPFAHAEASALLQPAASGILPAERSAMPSIPLPSWMLLLWCGLIAAIASEWLAALARSIRPAATRMRASAPRLMSAPRGSVPFAILSGTFAFAPLYGLAFEALARADLETGAAIGAAHGTLTAVLVLLGHLRRRSGTATPALRTVLGYRLRRLLTRTLYGALLGFLYVVPSV
jgi:hypothetical protein